MVEKEGEKKNNLKEESGKKVREKKNKISL